MLVKRVKSFKFVNKSILYSLLFQCGIVLAVLMLYLSGLLVKATSYFLLKSAIMARRRNYETLGK